MMLDRVRRFDPQPNELKLLAVTSFYKCYMLISTVYIYNDLFM